MVSAYRLLAEFIDVCVEHAGRLAGGDRAKRADIVAHLFAGTAQDVALADAYFGPLRSWGVAIAEVVLQVSVQTVVPPSRCAAPKLLLPPSCGG